MSIYNSHKHQYLSKRSIFLPLYEDLLKQLLTAGPDKVSMAFLRILLEDLRACIATCMSEIDYPQIIGLVLLHVHILRNITSSVRDTCLLNLAHHLKKLSYFLH